ncbi:urease accessory protein UreF [Nocardioides houyundeii]|uniref:urease accessory protein UreF n=1 Tax=Nocardioides houyundeii TaxID=2045452 RepID=UPI000C7954F5|nr:urease accessory UreF family protein [Nocardioides houyundeii]
MPPVQSLSSSAVSLLLSDARLPVGGHTQSGGLEPALLAGLSSEGIVGYCRTRLATVVRTEAATAVVARHVTLGHGDLGLVHAHWAARTPSAAQRETSAELGRGLLRLARRLWLTGADLAALGALPSPARPLVLGAVAARTGLDAHHLAQVVAYDDVQTVVAAGLKLAPGDPVVATGWVWEQLGEIDRLATQVAGARTPGDIPSLAAPQIEEWAQAHAHTTRRLFRA